MKKNNIDEKLIDDLLSRSIAEVIPSKAELKKKLLSGEKIKIYIGMDPTYTALHLGHSTNIIILEKFRKLGHKVIFLVGDFTARIGDPTDKDSARKQLSRDDVIKNMKKWIEMISPLISLTDKKNPVEIVYNHDWFSKMTFEDVINLSANFTVQQMLERDMFEKRMKEDEPIYVHEFFYPLMQGYDSVVLDVDIELCGTDQLFNALTGRTLLRKLKNKEKFVITTNLLANPKTGEKMMSKSKGTGVYLDETADEMFGKIMAQLDENIKQLFIDCTYEKIEDINIIDKNMISGDLNPRDAKILLAKKIVEIYHGKKQAEQAAENFTKVFSKHENPDKMPEVKLGKEEYVLIDIMLENKLVASKSDARRMIQQGAVKLDSEKITDVNFKLLVTQEHILKVGKRKFLRLKNA